MDLTRTQLFVSWALRVSIAAILLQTLFFKFTGSAESVYIFTKVGAEPWGRIGSGIAELMAAVLLLVPATVAAGAALSLGLIAGAIVSHLAILGLEIMDDGGLLFGLAVFVFIASALVLWLHRADIPFLGHFLAARAVAPPIGGGRR